MSVTSAAAHRTHGQHVCYSRLYFRRDHPKWASRVGRGKPRGSTHLDSARAYRRPHIMARPANKPVRRVALYGYLGSGNIGNDASFETVLGWLRTTHPSVDVRCITIAPEEVTARYGVPSSPLAWRPSGQGSKCLTGKWGKLLGRLLDVLLSYQLVGSADAIVVPGMGVLEDTLGVQPWGLPLWLLFIAIFCRLRGRSFVLLDVGAAWATNFATRLLTVVTVRLAAHVSYRDVSSAKAMARAGARKPAAVAPDLAFAHPTSTLAKPEPGCLVVGVMAYYGRADDPIRGAAVRRTYSARMADALATLAGAESQIILVGGDQVDVDVAREIESSVRRLRPDLPDDALIVRELTTFAEVTEEMSRAEVVIASRFHNLICALRLGRPTVSIGYAGKNRNLMQAVGVEGYCQDIEQLEVSTLVAQVESARRDAEGLTARIRQGTSHYALEVESLLEQLARDEFGFGASQSQVPDVTRRMNACRAE